MEQNKSSIGGIIGTVIIIAVIILGGLYFWGKRIEESKLKQEIVSEETSNEDENVEEVGSSDDLNTIEADLNNTNLDNLGAEIDAELQ